MIDQVVGAVLALLTEGALDLAFAMRVHFVLNEFLDARIPLAAVVAANVSSGVIRIRRRTVTARSAGRKAAFSASPIEGSECVRAGVRRCARTTQASAGTAGSSTATAGSAAVATGASAAPAPLHSRG